MGHPDRITLRLAFTPPEPTCCSLDQISAAVLGSDAALPHGLSLSRQGWSFQDNLSADDKPAEHSSRYNLGPHFFLIISVPYLLLYINAIFLKNVQATSSSKFCLYVS